LDEVTSPGVVSVRVFDSVAASRALMARGISIAIDGDWISIRGSRPEVVLQTLAEERIFPTEVRSPRLEDLFFETVQNEA